MTSRPLARRTLLAGAAGLVAAPFVAAGAAHAAPPRIYIDPGHGGTDPGAVGNGLQEKAVTLNIALQVRNQLAARFGSRVVVRMSRTTDITRSLTFRTDDANAWGANIFISIHINAGGGTGFESYRYPTVGSTTVRLHNLMHANVLAGMRSVSAVTNRGQKTANFHVLRETAMPAVLTENLFIDTVADANRLKNAAFITATARGHVNGIAAFFGL
jgi:N-acetylmuramoyl-L-alanine amidase